jgi:hypothetical protein
MVVIREDGTAVSVTSKRFGRKERSGRDIAETA